ncbi:hypothetical protein [Dokdonia sp.]|uniref:hypothetical protein n=1 Tax=Dokdonia sp. TaxID=2024995 RepID=UPI0032632357
MIASQFILLFSVAIEHTYYTNGICVDLHYKPSQQTQIVMDRYGLQLQRTLEGFSFYASTDQSIKDFLNYIKTTEDTTSFSFDVVSMNQDFTVFTDYPITTLGVFSFDSSHSIVVDGVTILKEVFEPRTASNISFSVTVDYDAIIRFRESGNNPFYTIKFRARKTQWRYYIINNSNQHFEKLEIKGDSEVQFDAPIEVTLPNNATALLFSSGDTKLPLQENATYTFNLLGTKTNLGNTRTQIILNGLPIAKSNSIETYTEEEGGTTQVASPLYIYI